MSGLQILIAVTVLLVSAISFISYFSGKKSLDSVKNRVVGDGQHGSDRFATKKEIEKMYDKVEFNPELWREKGGFDLKPGIIVGCEKKNGKIYGFADTDDVHALMIGSSGVGKTSYFLYPNLEYALASGVSFLSTDTKGDIYKNVAFVASKYYGYKVSVIDLRNPIKSDGNNFLELVNYYMDKYIENPNDIASKAKAEKYAKIISKNIIYSGEKNTDYGQNSFFYDAAEGLITSCILLVSEMCDKEERHIISVFKIVQELLLSEEKSIGKKRKKKTYKEILDLLPENHKARWFAGAALSGTENTILSVVSTALSRLNAFLDSELETILCRNSAFNAETFANEKCCMFIVLPEEDNTKHFMASLITIQLYRELLSIADEEGGRLSKKVMFYLDEFGTIPKIQSADMMFSASRSRNISIVAVIQSYAQLESNYGVKDAEIIADNTQLTIFGGFAPTSSSAKKLSDSLGTRTVQSASLSKGEKTSMNIQMIERKLMTEGELKSLNRGDFIVMKTFNHPYKFHLMLYMKWGISFPEEYSKITFAGNEIRYANKEKIENAINVKYHKYPDDIVSKLIDGIRPFK